MERSIIALRNLRWIAWMLVSFLASEIKSEEIWARDEWMAACFNSNT